MRRINFGTLFALHRWKVAEPVNSVFALPGKMPSTLKSVAKKIKKEKVEILSEVNSEGY